jgi:HAD superfamily hydrolase (TIGR01549 family)
VTGLEGITFDFGNTLVPFPAAPMAAVMRLTAERAASGAPFRADDFARAWGEERLRQLAEDVPEGREADMAVRLVRVLARLRGCPIPGAGERWDDVAAAAFSEPLEVASLLDAYAAIFVERTAVPPEIEPLLGRLADRYKIGILSNWPLSLAVDRYLEAAGWSRHLSAVVVSARVGCVKPLPGIFEFAARELGLVSGPAILHVGDDIGADVVGAQRVGWRAAWVRIKPEDSPLPAAAPVTGVVPDLTLDSVLELESALDPRRPDAGP